MPMQYEYTAIPEAQIPRAADAVFQHLLDTYASETNKVVSLWRQFGPGRHGFQAGGQVVHCAGHHEASASL